MAPAKQTATPKVTLADVAKLKADYAALEKEVADAASQRKQLEDELAHVRAALALAEQGRKHNENRVAELKQELAQVPDLVKAVAAEHPGIPPDEPRYAYEAVEGVPTRLFANQAEFDAAVKAQPNHWFMWPPDAEEAYLASQQAEVKDE